MPLWPWFVFAGLVTTLLTIDLRFFQHKGVGTNLRWAIILASCFISIGLGFTAFVYLVRNGKDALDYLTAFLIEESLSVDNLFVFLAIFRYFDVKAEHRHRVLFWGIMGAIILRAVFIFGGIALVKAFHWVVYFLGGLLVFMGIRLGFAGEQKVEPERNKIVQWAQKALPMEKSYHEDKFAIRNKGKLRFTPLFIVLLAIETTDVMFAIDSVPAVLAISRESFVVYSSNIFAVIGLRALYFVLAGAIKELAYLHIALAVILTLVGVKMLVSEIIEIPSWLSLVVVGTIIAAATLLSLRKQKK